MNNFEHIKPNEIKELNKEITEEARRQLLSKESGRPGSRLIIPGPDVPFNEPDADEKLVTDNKKKNFTDPEKLLADPVPETPTGELVEEEDFEQKKLPADQPPVVNIKEFEIYDTDEGDGSIAIASYDGNGSVQIRRSKKELIEQKKNQVDDLKIDQLDNEPKTESNRIVRDKIYNVKKDGGHHKGGHYASGQEKADTREMRKVRG